MLNFIIRRLLQLPLVMLALSLLIVGLLQMLTPEQRAMAYIQSENQMRFMDKIIKEHGLDQPFHVQYGKWLKTTLSGDLGFSKASNQSVVETIKERFPATVELSALAGILIVAFGVWFGTLAALHKNKFIDQFARVTTIIGYSLPSWVLGILLLVFFYGVLGILSPQRMDATTQIELVVSDFKQYTGLLTVDALLNGNMTVFWDAVKHLILPVITLTTILSARIVATMRSSLLEILGSDFVRTARAKGLPEKTVNIKHARRNALLPIITLSSIVIIELLSGAVFTETVFAFPGIGQWAGDCALRLDFNGIVGFALFSSAIVVVMSTLVDIMYGLVDPRVRFD